MESICFQRYLKVPWQKQYLRKNNSIYVQFYITARCNLTCQQCNIIYANSDMRECTLSEVERIADNLAQMGVAIVLLTGGEPFIRKDLPEIIYAFESRGVHVRMQTNGLAKEEQIHKVIEAGGADISISLDSLRPKTQDKVNGDFAGSWEEARKTIGTFTRYLPKVGSFGSLGCVLQRDNLTGCRAEVIKFGTKIGWYTSLVPVHVTHFARPRGFQTFDQSQRFLPKEYSKVDAVLDKVHEMREAGYLLYDSDQYSADIKSFVRDGSLSWRDRNDGVCDSPNLYFAILPNGQFVHAVTTDCLSMCPLMIKIFQESLRKKVSDLKSEGNVGQDGCMYGSYPEMTIAMRYFKATVQRVGNFLVAPPKKPWPLEDDEDIFIRS